MVYNKGMDELQICKRLNEVGVPQYNISGDWFCGTCNKPGRYDEMSCRTCECIETAFDKHGLNDDQKWGKALERFDANQIYKPTLQELLDHLGERFRNIAYRHMPKGRDWQAIGDDDGTPAYGIADTPWQATSLLIIELADA